MPEGAPFEDDDLLLELMDRNKPHLKPYAYRLLTWTRVLQEYNALTNNHYRQVRTLKKRFERLKGMYEDDANKVLVSDIERLERLVNEADRAGKNSRIDKSMLKVRQKQREWQKNPQAATPGPNIPKNRGEEDNEDNVASISENSQPPPLDSITVGFPHNASSPRRPEAATPGSARSLFENSPSGGQQPLSAAPCDSAQQNAHQQKVHHSHYGHDSRNRNMDVLDKFFESTMASSNVPISSPNANTADNNSLTLENFYLEFKQYRRSQEEFQRDLLHKLDLLIEIINRKG